MFGDSVDSKLVSYYCWLAAGNVRPPQKTIYLRISALNKPFHVGL